jgi:hypothetical protein
MDESRYGRSLDGRMVLYGVGLLIGSVGVVGFASYALMEDAFSRDPVGFSIKAGGVLLTLGLAAGIAVWRRRVQQAKWEALDAPVEEPRTRIQP